MIQKSNYYIKNRRENVKKSMIKKWKKSKDKSEFKKSFKRKFKLNKNYLNNIKKEKSWIQNSSNFKLNKLNKKK